MTEELEKLLGEMEERANQATPGPWRFNGAVALWSGKEGGKFLFSRIPSFAAREKLPTPSYEEQDANCHFIASARTDVPRLIAALREALKQRDYFIWADASNTVTYPTEAEERSASVREHNNLKVLAALKGEKP